MGTNMPSKNNPALIWLEAHIDQWTTGAAAIGLTDPQTTELSARIDTARQSFIAIEAARSEALALTVQYNQQATEMRSLASRMVADIKAFAENQTNPSTVYTSAGMTPARHRSPAPAPERPVGMNADLGGDGSVTIHFRGRGPAGTVWEITRKLEGEIVYTHVGHADVATKSFTDRTIPSTVNSAAYNIRGVRGSTAGPTSMPMVVGFGRAVGAISKAA